MTGYLKDEGCHKAYKDFLVESAHLHEYATFLQRGVEYPTKIGGKGLVNMLDDYGRIKLYGKYKNFTNVSLLFVILTLSLVT